ncbi:amidohydrolase/deacetylase family metallohydrolase [Neobacillus mesonae]|nr:amidohydrolase/deacetylase family metallohydrolase [Neobacillus mesonae]
MHTRVLRSVRTVYSQERFDLVIKQGRIIAYEQPGTAIGDEIIECSSLYVSSGWIDLHVHAMNSFEPYGDSPDEIGVGQGVTTIVDAGSCGADQIQELYAESGRARTRMLALLNISRIGLGTRQDELSRAEWVDEQTAVEAAAKYSDFVVGLKARISSSVVKEEGVQPLIKAARISKHTGLPLMIHIGSGPPALDEVLGYMRTGDAITHYLNGKKNNILNEHKLLIPAFKSAVERGVHLDVGHGSASFSFEVAESAKEQGIHPGTISTDIYRGNRISGPVHSLAEVMTKFVIMGYSLADVVDKVTAKAAYWLGRPELGRIQLGDEANLTLFEVVPRATTLMDSMGATRTTESVIETKGAIIGEHFYTS